MSTFSRPFWHFVTSILCIIPLNLLFIRPYNNVYVNAQSAGADQLPLQFPVAPCGSIILEEATIDQLQLAMTNGSLTSRQLVACYIDRIFQTNEYLHSVLQVNPDALMIAAERDQERSAGQVSGPLHGIPFLVKDNIATKDRMETTAGSTALLGSIVPRDAFVVERLRAAGAVLLGKAALSEWSSARSTNYSEGYNARGGQIRSPYNLTRQPGGSSGGSAVAVASNIVPFALGTDTSGSVIDPAERNAVVGLRPTVGLTSRSGVIPISRNMDTVGVFGRTVRDAAYALDSVFGIDPLDNFTSAQGGNTPTGLYSDYLATAESLVDATFGLPWSTFWVNALPEQQTILLDLIELMKSAGATIINETEIPDYQRLISPDGWNWDYGSTRGYPNESEYTVAKTDLYNDMATYLSQLSNTEMKSLEDIVQYNYDNEGTEGGYPWPAGSPGWYSGQDALLKSLDTKGIMNETYYQALSFVKTFAGEKGLDVALQHNGTTLSGLLVPSDVGQAYQIAAQAGYPMITISAGINSDIAMPFGLGIMQTAWGEAELLKWANAIEDLQRTSGTPYRRTLPRWFNYLGRNLPVDY